MAACREWPGGALPRTFSFVTSETPALFMAGAMDHVTPVQWAQDAASGLLNSRVVTIPDLGHFPDGLSNMECYDQVINAFFEAGSAANLDLSCVASMKPPPFAAGSGLPD
jgi:pimeloyl-ACP methyl ester carboxylesterase